MYALRSLFIFSTFLFYVNLNIVFSQGPQQQIEEGWRWRRSLDVYLQTGVNFHGPIPAQRIHEEMTAHEISLSRSLSPIFPDANIALASLSMVIQTDNNILQRRTNWLTPPNGVPCYFPSTAGAGFLNGAFPPNTWVNPFVGGVLDDQTLRDHLGPLFFDPAVEANGLGGAQAAINFPPNPNFPFAINFQHSEQKLIYYLWNASLQDNWNDQPYIRNRLIDLVGGYPEANIRAVFLHVHSRLDLCTACRFSVSVLSHKVRNALINQIGPNVRFLTTVSSRNNYENTRYRAGHDTGYLNNISLNIGALPQIAQPLQQQQGWHNLAVQAQAPAQPVVVPNPLNVLGLPNPPVLLSNQANPPQLPAGLVNPCFYTTIPDNLYLQSWNTYLPLSE